MHGPSPSSSSSRAAGLPCIRGRPGIGALALAVLFPLAACVGGDTGAGDRSDAAAADGSGGAAGAEASPRVVEVVGTDYAFRAPSTVPAGWTAFHFANEGAEPHHATVVRLEGDVTVEDVRASFGSGEPPAGGLVALGGPNAVMTGSTTRTVVELTPGRYALICFIPSPDGELHLVKGMIHGFTVAAAGSEDAGAASEPEAHAELEMMDYAFRQSAALSAGRRTIRVVNVAEDRDHEAVLARLADGRTAEDMVDWIRAYEEGAPPGPPPGEFLGGVAGLAAGGANYFVVDLEPGRYVWLCPMVDAPGRPSHLHHGMYLAFQVT